MRCQAKRIFVSWKVWFEVPVEDGHFLQQVETLATSAALPPNLFWIEGVEQRHSGWNSSLLLPRPAAAAAPRSTHLGGWTKCFWGWSPGGGPCQAGGATGKCLGWT